MREISTAHEANVVVVGGKTVMIWGDYRRISALVDSGVDVLLEEKYLKSPSRVGRLLA